jgi:hypothetical protein
MELGQAVLVQNEVGRNKSKYFTRNFLKKFLNLKHNMLFDIFLFFFG